MKKITFVSILLLSISSFVHSEIDVGINLGYGFGINGTQGDNILPSADFEGSSTIDGDEHYDKYKDEYTSLGNGLKFGVDGTFYIAENFGVLAGIDLSFAGKTSADTKNENVDLNVTTTSEYEIVANHLAINVGLKIKTDIDIFTPYIVVAPGLYIPFGVDGSETIKIEPGITTKDEFEIKYAAGFGIKTILGAKIKLSDGIDLKAELTPNFASARVKEKITTDEDGNKTTIIYEKNEENLPLDKTNTFYEHGGPKHSFNSFGINIGVNFSF